MKEIEPAWTPEPLVCRLVNGRWYVGPYSHGIIEPVIAELPRQHEATARRICASYNACKGIPTEALENHALAALLSRLQMRLTRFEQERLGVDVALDELYGIAERIDQAEHDTRLFLAYNDIGSSLASTLDISETRAPADEYLALVEALIAREWGLDE